MRYAIESSGYPLEIRVAQALSSKGYMDVTPSWDYRDPTTGESREIDVAAWQTFDVKHRGSHCQPVMLHVLIECKRSPAFVVYSAHPKEILTGIGYDSMALSYFGRPGVLWKARPQGWFGTPIIEHLSIGESLWKWPDCVGSHYAFVHATKDQARLNSKKYSRRQFKAGDEDYYHRKLLGLIKAAFLYREPYVGGVVRGGGSVQPHFLIPILVLDADLYEYDVNGGQLRPIARAALCRSYQGEFAGRFRIDVVQEAELNTYLEELERDFSAVASRIGSEHPLWEQALNHEYEMRTRSAQPAAVP